MGSKARCLLLSHGFLPASLPATPGQAARSLRSLGQHDTWVRRCLVSHAVGLAIVVDEWLFRLLLLSAVGETPRVAERTPQEELHLGVDAPQVVRGPPPEGVEDLGVQAQEKGLPFAHV